MTVLLDSADALSPAALRRTLIVSGAVAAVCFPVLLALRAAGTSGDLFWLFAVQVVASIVMFSAAVEYLRQRRAERRWREHAARFDPAPWPERPGDEPYWGGPLATVCVVLGGIWIAVLLLVLVAGVLDAR